jgi:hypothetical protein
VSTPDQDEATLLGCAATWLHFVRTVVMAPLSAAAVASGAGSSSAASLTLPQLQRAWDERVEPKLAAALGPSACADSSSKKGGCGPLQTALLTALKSRIGGSASSAVVKLPRDVLEAFASSTMVSWLERYAESSVSANVVVATASKYCAPRELIAATLQRVMQQWIEALQTAQSRAGAGASLVVSSSPSAEATLADFRPLVSHAGPASLFALVFELTRPSAKLTGSAGSGHAGRVQREMEIAGRHKTVLAKFDATWGAMVLAQSGGGKGGRYKAYGGASGSASATFAAAEPSGGANEGDCLRTCKLFGADGLECLERDRSIGPTSKFVFVRCSAGCKSSFHQPCFQTAITAAEAAAAEEQQQERAEDKENADWKPCVHAAENKCAGHIESADLKQQGKVSDTALYIPARKNSNGGWVVFFAHSFHFSVACVSLL